MKILKLLTFISAGAMMFFSCTELPDENNDNGNDNGDDGNDPVGSTELVLLASEMIIHANGEDAVEFTEQR